MENSQEHCVLFHSVNRNVMIIFLLVFAFRQKVIFYNICDNKLSSFRKKSKISQSSFVRLKEYHVQHINVCWVFFYCLLCPKNKKNWTQYPANNTWNTISSNQQYMEHNTQQPTIHGTQYPTNNNTWNTIPRRQQYMEHNTPQTTIHGTQYPSNNNHDYNKPVNNNTWNTIPRNQQYMEHNTQQTTIHGTQYPAKNNTCMEHISQKTTIPGTQYQANNNAWNTFPRKQQFMEYNTPQTTIMISLYQ